ncbi:MAG: universal stress protein [Desulfobacteraceae bacterium]|nr:MAG: universal stress protein [Desulfobacteraceae bacterium]
MYKKILAPLDGSKRAETILPHVEDLAIRYRGQVVFLQVIEIIEPFAAAEFAFSTQENYDALRKQAEAYLSGIKGEFREKGIDASIRLAHGPVVEAIIEVAEQENAGLIAIASHGRTGLSRVFYGSVSAGVLHRIDRPLLLIRSA